jgi:hypothetical protein
VPPRGLLVAQPGQVGTDFLGEALQVAAADVDVRCRPRGQRRLLGGFQLPGQGDEAAEEVRGVAVVVQAQTRP